MRVNPYLYGLLALAVFLGVAFGAQSLGYWSVSGKVTATGEKVTATGTDVAEIKGWMKLGDVAAAYGFTVEEIATAFNLPSDVNPDKQLKDLESETFSVTRLRTWLAERQKQ